MPSEVLNALISGSIAGLAVDLALFPIDTLKTRLQSEVGFWKSGGFRSVYSGLPAVAIGSAPGAALFFLTYEFSKAQLFKHTLIHSTLNHMVSSSIAEVMACLVRVPCEVVKQRSQAGQGSVLSVVKSTYRLHRLPGFYAGFLSTITREIPFSVIQFPLWEYIKASWSDDGRIEPWKSALSGALAGSVAAFLTTPLDVAKTRIMLDQNSESEQSIYRILRKVYKSKGIKGLWSGGVPRVMWISIGGFIFLGAYDTTKHYLAGQTNAKDIS